MKILSLIYKYMFAFYILGLSFTYFILGKSFLGAVQIGSMTVIIITLIGSMIIYHMGLMSRMLNNKLHLLFINELRIKRIN